MLKKIMILGVAVGAITYSFGFSNIPDQEKGNFNEYIPYTITEEGSAPNVEVYQKINSKEDFEKKALQKFNNKYIPVTITFKEPLNTKDFKHFINKTDFKVEDYKIRAFDNGSDDLVTIGGRPLEDEIVPQNILDTMLEGSTFEGFIAVRGEIKLTQGNYNKLAKDDTVLLVDLSTDLIKDEVSKKKNINPSDIQEIDYVEDVYWYHENF